MVFGVTSGVLVLLVASRCLAADPIYVRGQGSGRPGAEIATLVDGIPRFVSVWTHPLVDVLASDMADRIDVYKSAQPALFGNLAFADVNLVPKSVAREGAVTRITGRLR
jgi:hypothetical protein